ncbi:MAG: hypothetical protein PXX77_03575, partial [Gallionella sp.]|nr:hypothetical protein [Gallionella sp.]
MSPRLAKHRPINSDSGIAHSASFEALYSGFARMHEQRTWEAILNTPVTLDDIVLSEVLWAASKSLMAGMA